MNILLIGPGKDPNKFGQTFCRFAREEGHNLKTLSHRSFPLQQDSEDHVFADFEDPTEFEHKLNRVLSTVDRIDLVVYNANGGGGINSIEQFAPGYQIDVDAWVTSVFVHGICANIVASISLLKMDEQSSFVFLSSSASYLINRDNYLQHASYFGFKGIQNQMMRGYAEYNQKGSRFCVFAPHIPYEEPETAIKIMRNLYTRATKLRDEDNGKIIQFYPPDGDPHYHDK